MSEESVIEKAERKREEKRQKDAVAAAARGVAKAQEERIAELEKSLAELQKENEALRQHGATLAGLVVTDPVYIFRIVLACGRGQGVRMNGRVAISLFSKAFGATSYAREREIWGVVQRAVAEDEKRKASVPMVEAKPEEVEPEAQPFADGLADAAQSTPDKE